MVHIYKYIYTYIHKCRFTGWCQPLTREGRTYSSPLNCRIHFYETLTNLCLTAGDSLYLDNCTCTATEYNGHTTKKKKKTRLKSCNKRAKQSPTSVKNIAGEPWFYRTTCIEQRSKIALLIPSDDNNKLLRQLFNNSIAFVNFPATFPVNVLIRKWA